MPLIKCFECNREISDLATSCPGCGAPANGHIVERLKQQKHIAPPPAKKSRETALTLAFFFGPLGLIYSSPGSAIVLTLLSIPMAVFTFGIGLILIWIGALVAASSAVTNYNAKIDKQICEMNKPEEFDGGPFMNFRHARNPEEEERLKRVREIEEEANKPRTRLEDAVLLIGAAIALGVLILLIKQWF